MKLIRGIAATTHPDRHGDQLTVGTLVRNAEEANAAYYLLLLNHDPRIPPIGRIVRSNVAAREDGSAALEFVAQQFEEGDTFDISSTSRRLPPHVLGTEPEIVYDNSFDDPESLKAIFQLASTLGLKARKQTKKSFDPLTVLTVVLSLTAAGFFAPMGGDLYSLLKKGISALLKRRQKTIVLVFRFGLVYGVRKLQCEIFITNPTNNQILALSSMKGSEVEKLLAPLSSQAEVVKAVAEFSGDTLVPRFSVRGDGVPLDSSGRVIAYKGELPPGLSISFQDETIEDRDSDDQVASKRTNRVRPRKSNNGPKRRKS